MRHEPPVPEPTMVRRYEEVGGEREKEKRKKQRGRARLSKKKKEAGKKGDRK